MFLSKHKNGFYYVYYDNKFGRRASISTKSKKKKGAIEFLTNFKEELRKREVRKTIPIKSKRFFFEYLVYSELIHSYKTVLSEKTTFNELNKYFGDIDIRELTKEKIMDFMLYRLRKVSFYAVVRDLQDLRGAFNWGIQKNYVETNQCIGIKRPKLPEKLPLYFTDDEFKRFSLFIDNEDLRDIIYFAVNTGLRQTELVELEWNQINIDERILWVNNQVYMSKTKKVRSIPLNDKAMEILNKRIVDKKDENVFKFNGVAMKQNMVSHRFKKYVRKSGVNPKLKFHSLRHTFASWLVQRGVSIYDVSKLLGHSNIRSTEIYAHLRIDELRGAVKKLD